MMNLFGITHLGFFCVAVLLLNATPGPDTAYIVGRSIAQGRLAGVVSAMGISAGCCLHAIALAIGLGALLSASATAYLLVKLTGAAYLMYLGIRMLLTSAANKNSDRPTQTARPFSIIFWQALLTNLLNPKVIMFFLSFFPQFVAPEAPHKTLAFLTLGVVFVLMSTCWNCGTAFVAGSVAQHLKTRGHYQRWLERGVGTVFLALGARLALVES